MSMAATPVESKAAAPESKAEVAPRLRLHPRRGSTVTTDHADIYGEYIVVKGRGCKVVGDYNYIYGDDCVVEGMFNKVYGRNVSAPGYNTIFRSAERKDSATEALINTASARRQREPVQRQRPPPPPRPPVSQYRSRPQNRPRPPAAAGSGSGSASGFSIFGIDIGSHLERMYMVPTAEDDAEAAELRRNFVSRLRAMRDASAPLPALEEAKLPVVTATSASAASEQKNPGLKCCACTERLCNAVLEPCMHVCVCRECSLHIQNTTNKCPTCRAAIVAIRPIFFAGGS